MPSVYNNLVFARCRKPLTQICPLKSKIFPQSDSHCPIPNLKRERKICPRLFTSSFKREIRKFHVVVRVKKKKKKKKKKPAKKCTKNYNIAHVHPNLIPIGVIMVHFSTCARPCVHQMTCASQMGEACARCVFKKTFTEKQHHKRSIFIRA